MKKQNNKILLIVLFLLLLVFVLTKVFRSPGRESNLERDIFKIDTAKVSAIEFRRGDQEAELILRKKNGGWTVEQDSRSAAAERYGLKHLLETLTTLEPNRVVSRKKDKWSDYQVGDSASLQMAALDSEGKEIARWRIGSESQGTTYIRPEKENEVYAVEGNLRSRFDKSFHDWRDKTFLRMKADLVQKITFSYPADSGFVLEKNSGVWTIDRQKADSAKVEAYLRKLQSKDLTNFASGPPSGDPDVTVLVQGTSMPQTEVKGWKRSGQKWILASSAQQDAYFSDSTFADDLLAGKRALLKMQ